MASHDSIQNLLTKEDCEKILHRSLDFLTQLLSYKITKFQNDVAGFLGDHFLLTIKFTTKDVIAQTTFFMKTVPQFNFNQLNYVQEAGIFKKEAIVYQNLLSELQKIASFGPKCYYIKDNCIVLEDLKVKGFRMMPKLDLLDEAHCRSLLYTLARFHASTIIFEHKKGVRINLRYPEEIKEACFSFIEGQPRQKWCVSSTKCVMDLMKLLPCSNGIVEEACEKFRKFVFEKLPGLIVPSTRYRNVLTHDDLWCNNLLFNDKPECLFVDFQLVRYTPPSLDFLLALFLNLRSSCVEENLDKFVDVYYTYLVKEVKKHNLDSSELPKKEFVESLECYKLTALTEAVMYGTHVFISEELANHIVADFNKYNEFSFINRSKFAVKEFQENRRYRERLGDILTSLINVLIDSK